MSSESGADGGGDVGSVPPIGRDGALLERDAELAALREAVRAAGSGDGRGVVIGGHAGIGKSRLLAEARTIAADAQFSVLTARGIELEQEYPFGVVRQLFEAAAHGGTAREWFDGPAHAALPVFDSPNDDHDDVRGDTPFAVLHGLYWMTVNASADHPVLLTVDDVQYCDRASLRFLAHLLPRLGGLPVMLAVGLRQPGPEPNLLVAVTGSAAMTPLRPAPLSEYAVARLVGDRFGVEPDGPFAAACQQATGGNPLLVAELLSAMSAAHVVPDSGHTVAVAEIAPQAVAPTVLRRLLALPPDAVEVARTIAIVGEGAESATVATLAGIDRATLARAINDLVQAEILAHQSPLGFVHPLVREAVYHDLLPGDRELRHGRAAVTLRDIGASSVRVAGQVLATTSHSLPWATEVLRDAARSAMHAGAADSAVAYLRRALADPQGARADLLHELGMAEALVDAPAAVEHLTAAYAALRGPNARSGTAGVLAQLLIFTRPAGEAAVIARRAAEELPDDWTDTRRSLQALELYSVHFGAPNHDTSGRLARAIGERSALGEGLGLGDGSALGEGLGLGEGGPGQAALLAVAAWDRALTGSSAAECVELVHAAMAGGVLIATDPGLLALAAASVLILADADDALATCDAILAEARRHGSLLVITGTHMCQGWAWLARGELAEAEQCLREAAREEAALHDNMWNAGTPYRAAFLARVLLERGDITGARQAVVAGGTPARGSDAEALGSRVRIEVLLAAGRYQEAAGDAARCAARAGRIVNPGWAPWSSLRARALAALGDGAAATTLFEEDLRLARVWGAPGVLGPALRRLGTHRDGPAGLDLLHEAIAVTAGSPNLLEHGKTLAALGAALSRSGHAVDARPPLREAFEIATRCGATPLADRARSDLADAGGRPHAQGRGGTPSLTPSERRVADLAAAGHSNRAIARLLYVTPKTVEVHLSNAYRKLRIHTREDLAGALPGPG